jgi:hypothetical protein
MLHLSMNNGKLCAFHIIIVIQLGDVRLISVQLRIGYAVPARDKLQH